MKPDNVRLTSIAASGNSVFGLGDDNVVYRWDPMIASWRLHGSSHPENSVTDVDAEPRVIHEDIVAPESESPPAGNVGSPNNPLQL